MYSDFGGWSVGDLLLWLARARCPQVCHGTTAVVAVITPRYLYIANCGDSRAVLCKDGVAVREWSGRHLFLLSLNFVFGTATSLDSDGGVELEAKEKEWCCGFLCA